MTKEIRVADLLARTVEEGDCLLWTGCRTDTGYPRYGKLPVRRVIWSSIHGPVPKGLQVGCSCKTPLCVNPEHLVARTKSKSMRGIRKSPATIARIAMTKRARLGKLTMEIARAIRASDKPAAVLDREHGLCRGKSWAIRNNLIWKDTANPFTGLGARP